MMSHFDRAVLSLWPPLFGDAQIESEHCGFSGAAIWRIAVTGERFALRRWPSRAPDPVRLAGLHRLLAELSRRGIHQLSVPLPARNGATLVNFDRHWWQLEAWMPGRACYRDEPSRAKLAAAMTAFADFHRAAVDHHPEPASAEWFAPRDDATSPAVRERLTMIASWQVRHLDAGLREQVRRLPEQLQKPLLGILASAQRTLAPLQTQLRPLADLSFRLQPVLRDAWHDHLLFTGDELTGLIDPSACRVDHPVVDLSRLLASLLEPEDTAGRDFALQTYQQRRPFSVLELRLFGPLYASQSLLAGLNWIDRVLISPVSDADVPRLATHLREIERKARGR